MIRVPGPRFALGPRAGRFVTALEDVSDSKAALLFEYLERVYQDNHVIKTKKTSL